MQVIDNLQGSIDEKELLNIINTIQSQLDMFQKHKNNDIKVLILVGDTGSGKSTMFNILCGAKFQLLESEDGVVELQLDETSSEFSLMKGGMQSITKEPKYYFSQEFNHLLIDFPGFQDTNGEFDQIMIQMLFYKISTQSNVKIIYVVRYPEKQFQGRGANLQEFIIKTFKDQSICISKLTLLLNAFNEEDSSDQEAKESAREQLQEQFKIDCSNLNLVLQRKVSEQEDIQDKLSEENRKKIWEEIIKSNEISIEPITIPHTEKISAYLSLKSFSFIEGVCSLIYSNLIKKLEKTEINQIQSLQDLISTLKSLKKISNSNFVQWFEDFARVSISIAQQLGCQGEIKQKSEDFLKIYLFFSQFSKLINGYFECQKNSTFASTQYQDMICIINNRMDFLKEKRNVEQTTAQKQEEIRLKNNAISQANYQRSLRDQYYNQQRQLQSDTEQLQRDLNNRQQEKQNLDYRAAQLRADYNRQEQERQQTKYSYNQSIQCLKNKIYEYQGKVKTKQTELSKSKQENQDKQNYIQKQLNEQQNNLNMAKDKIYILKNQESALESQLRSLQNQNAQLTNQINQKREEIRQLNQKLIEKQRRRGNKCQIF